MGDDREAYERARALLEGFCQGASRSAECSRWAERTHTPPPAEGRPSYTCGTLSWSAGHAEAVELAPSLIALSVRAGAYTVITHYGTATTISLQILGPAECCRSTEEVRTDADSTET